MNGLALMVPALAALAGPAGELAAQSVHVLAGRVTHGNGETGVPGVRILIPGLQLETTTDAQGWFQFRTVPPGGHAIRAELVGCQSGAWTARVGTEPNELRLRLDGPAVAAFRERVAAGSASPVSEAELPFTVHWLERKDVNHAAARTLADLIRGRFPGIKVVQGSGQPGERISIQFRGRSSMTGSRAPLVVVDGLVTEGGVEDLDPRDIERIEILKGAAAAAAYGARGEAGVIEITMRNSAPQTAPRCFFTRDGG